jgi:putative MFS transporter
MLYAFAAIAICTLYQVRSPEAQQLCMIATVFGFGAANTATHVYASELFPTAIRATGYGWTTNLFGRIAEFATPLAIGALIASAGVSIPVAVAIVSIGPILGAVLVWFRAPETRGLTLEEIERAAGA